ncbi:MAG: hypothetical protein Q7S76_03260 [bacterium]|nr:hypothetical protein [bacterium]
MANVVRQIIGSFEDIGKNVAHEVVQVPKDIMIGSALEALGAGGKKTSTGGQIGQIQKSEQRGSVFRDIDSSNDRGVKQTLARKALEYLAARPKSQEAPVRVRLENEEREKKDRELRERALAERSKLPNTGSVKKRPGMGIRPSRLGSEKGKNARQD